MPRSYTVTCPTESCAADLSVEVYCTPGEPGDRHCPPSSEEWEVEPPRIGTDPETECCCARTSDWIEDVEYLAIEAAKADAEASAADDAYDTYRDTEYADEWNERFNR